MGEGKNRGVWPLLLSELLGEFLWGTGQEPPLVHQPPASFESGQPIVLFKNPGTFLVRAIDSGGNSSHQATVNVPVIDSQHASLKVFVSPTAQSGDRLAKASNDQGANTGPGKVFVTPAEASHPEK